MEINNFVEQIVIEEFKKIDGYENYSVSKNGNVRNDLTDKILKHRKDKNGYSNFTLSKNGKLKTHKVHRLVAIAFILNPDDKLCVDHIDENKTNNNLTNLRWATKTENGQNKGKNKNNTSGFKGVSYDKTKNKYRAVIKINEKRKHLGYFKTAKEASAEYDESAKENHKEFYYKNK